MMHAIRPVHPRSALVKRVNGLVHKRRARVILRPDVVSAQNDIPVVLKATGELAIAPPAFNLGVFQSAARALQMREHELNSWVSARWCAKSEGASVLDQRAKKFPAEVW
jgi:hypothetical protein